MSSNPWDFQPLETVFGHSVSVVKLEPDDVLIFRVNNASLRDHVLMEHTVDKVKGILPPNTRTLFVSEDWEIAIARPTSNQDVIDGLTDLQKSLRG